MSPRAPLIVETPPALSLVHDQLETEGALSDAAEAVLERTKKRGGTKGKTEGDAPPEARPAQLTKVQSFVVERVHRSKLKGAPYNPRLLKAVLKKHGLVEPVVWNKRSGNLVGGHQRIGLVDALEGTSNYLIDVSVVDIGDKEERELNIALNNPHAQGAFDLEKLGDMFKGGALDVAATGYDLADLYKLFGTSPLVDQEGAIDELGKKLREQAEAYAGVRATSKNRSQCDFYLVVVFEDDDARDRFTDRLKLDRNRYQDGRELARLCGVTLDPDVPPDGGETPGPGSGG